MYKRQIYYCPAGLVFAAASVSDEYGEPAGSLVAGPALMENTEDLLTELPDGLRERAAALPVLPPAQVTHLAEVLRACAAFAAGLPHSRAGGFVYEQEKLLSAIYNAREKQLTEENAAVYPIAYEKKDVSKRQGQCCPVCFSHRCSLLFTLSS